MRIDAEVSLCDRARFTYPWMDRAPAHLQRDFSIDDIALILSRNRFGGAVLVGQLPGEPAETDWLLDIAARHPIVVGVLTASPSPRDWDRWQANPAFLGVSCAPASAARELASRRLACTMNVADAITALDAAAPGGLRLLVRATAGQSFAIAPAFESWRTQLAPLVSPQLTVPLLISGLINDATPGAWRSETYRPWIQHLIAHFGPARLVYGSGWPFCMRCGTWKEELAAFTQALGAQTLESRELIFENNAAIWCGLGYTK